MKDQIINYLRINGLSTTPVIAKALDMDCRLMYTQLMQLGAKSIIRRISSDGAFASATSWILL